MEKENKDIDWNNNKVKKNNNPLIKLAIIL